jgi:quercetin dioxygenase-like cupin family protein
MHPYTTPFTSNDEAPTLVIDGQSVTRLADPGRTNGHYGLDRLRLKKGATLSCGGDNDPFLRGWYVVSGEVQLGTDQHAQTLDEGAFALMPMQSVHTITVTSEMTDLLRFELPASRRKLFKPIFSHRNTAPARWNVGILWIMLAIDQETSDHFSLIEELVPKGNAAPWHLHEWMDEGFYIMEGEATFWVADQELKAKSGSFLSVPMGTRHSFRIDSDSARLLNWYTPPGFEHVLLSLGVEAKARTLPPADLPPVDMGLAMALFDQWGQTNFFNVADLQLGAGGS